MIGYLSGRIVSRDARGLVLGVGAALGSIGYRVFLPDRSPYRELSFGCNVELYISTCVRENSIDLYGFMTDFEMSFFELLLEASGVGPKLAMSLLSHRSPLELSSAIVGENLAVLTSVPGVGKKTAERLCIDLRDKIRKRLEQGTIPTIPTNAGEQASADALEALVGLGFRIQDVKPVLRKLEIEMGPAASTDAIIRKALPELRT